MGQEDMISMSQRELRRVQVVGAVLEGKMKQVEAAEVLDLSDRQVRRLVRRVETQGPKGLVHGLRGRPSNRRTDERLKARVLRLYEKCYGDFGPTLGAEKLLERDRIEISDETLRLWLIEAKVSYRGRRARPHRRWRERKACFGQMVQMDGSHHEWLEGRGPGLVLMAYKDDATGKVFGRFYGYEGTVPALDSLKRYLASYGIPQSVYVDKHSTYKSTERVGLEDELAGREEALSQFARACQELGIEVIYAHSPQAKGRIERQFRTFQHRLIREMRLAGARSLEAANEVLERYLPVYNERFEVPAANETDLHRPVGKGLNLDGVLCVKARRVVRNDWTVAYQARLYQITEPLRAKGVEVQERLDGTLRLTHEGRSVGFTEVAARARVERTRPPKLPTRISMRRQVPKTHPWKRYVPGIFKNAASRVACPA